MPPLHSHGGPSDPTRPVPYSYSYSHSAGAHTHGRERARPYPGAPDWWALPYPWHGAEAAAEHERLMAQLHRARAEVAATQPPPGSPSCAYDHHSPHGIASARRHELEQQLGVHPAACPSCGFGKGDAR